MLKNEMSMQELKEEEVNVYTEDCGATRLKCVTDCLWVFPLITAGK